MNENKGIEIRPEPITARSSVLPAKFLTSPKLSIVHYRTAKLFLKNAQGIEYSTDNNQSDNLNELQSYVIGSVLSSVCFLEAIINEVYWEASESPNEEMKNLGDEAIKTMSFMWKYGADMENILKKYQMALDITGHELFDESKVTYQNVKLLIKLRNALVHFKPGWVGDEPQNLEKNLKGKFVLNRLAPPATLFFPHRCLGYGCAEWAIKSSENFVTEFLGKLGLTVRFK